MQLLSFPPCLSWPILVHIPRCTRAVGWGVEPVLWDGGCSTQQMAGSPPPPHCIVLVEDTNTR